uniref:Ig-like domain-containing protein n=1 Tax=Panagrellus redivivus TaxID=6233 RepID=A0A7E4UUB1_PANRE
MMNLVLIGFGLSLLFFSEFISGSEVAQNQSLMSTHPIYKLIRKKIPRVGNAPLDVKFGFYIESLGNFRSNEMAFDVDMYLYMSWTDAAMEHDDEEYVLINDKTVLENMWVPDLYFANARTAYFHDVTVPNFNMFINKDGVIAYGTRVTLTVACNLVLKNYPLDSQTCSIKIISYAHVIPMMNVTWFNEGAVRFNAEIGLPEFKIMSIRPAYCNGTFHYTITENSSRVGEFSCLMGLIELERAIGYHLVQSYLPNAAIVIISWVSFWIDRRAVPARVSLSFTCLLTLSTQGNGLRYALPPVAYSKAIDHWFGVCMLFIFGVLLEFALVNSYMRRANKYNNLAQSMRWSTSHGYHPGETDTDTEDGPLRRHKLGSYVSQPELVYKAMFFNRRALAVDQISRVAFPGGFACFNFMYWYYYLYYSVVTKTIDPES